MKQAASEIVAFGVEALGFQIVGGFVEAAVVANVDQPEWL